MVFSFRQDLNHVFFSCKFERYGTEKSCEDLQSSNQFIPTWEALSGVLEILSIIKQQLLVRGNDGLRLLDSLRSFNGQPQVPFIAVDSQSFLLRT